MPVVRRRQFTDGSDERQAPTQDFTPQEFAPPPRLSEPEPERPPRSKPLPPVLPGLPPPDTAIGTETPRERADVRRVAPQATPSRPPVPSPVSMPGSQTSNVRQVAPPPPSPGVLPFSPMPTTSPTSLATPTAAPAVNRIAPSTEPVPVPAPVVRAPVAPIKPIGSPSVGVATPQSGRVFGSMGGLQGGGFGLPLDPTSDEASDPISTLIKKLLQGR